MSDTDQNSVMNISSKCVSCSSNDAHCILDNCLHSFCRDCIESTKNSKTHVCNKCNESSSKISQPESPLKSPNCGWCSSNGEQNKSVGHCDDCSTWLCAECLKGHKRMPQFRNHSTKMTVLSETHDSLRCETHPHEALDCFCESCNMLTCRDCQLSVHRDHGTHHWVLEKANMLHAPLKDGIEKLDRCRELLTASKSMAHNARTIKSGDTFLASVQTARDAIEKNSKLLMEVIQRHTTELLVKLDDISAQNIACITEAENLTSSLKDQIDHVTNFSNRLIVNIETDPASLVQFYASIKNRIDKLQMRADELCQDLSQTESYESGWCPNRSKGWKSIVDTRALYVSQWKVENVSAYCGRINWLSNIGSPISSSNADQIDSADERRVDNGKLSSADFNTFIDSLRSLDQQIRDPQLGVDPNTTNRGCSVCFDVGQLMFCSHCHRAFHSECHLPPESVVKARGTSDWICSLCAVLDEDDGGPPKSKVKRLDTAGVQNDYTIGCRIMLELLLDPAAVHFSASLCPVCCLPLVPRLSLPSDSYQEDVKPADNQLSIKCPADHLFHKLTRLRADLVDSVLLPDHSWALDDWLNQLDAFLLAIITSSSDDDSKLKTNNSSSLLGVTHGCSNAARRLRSRLGQLIREVRPSSQLSSSIPVNDDEHQLPDVPCNGGLATTTTIISDPLSPPTVSSSINNGIVLPA